MSASNGNRVQINAVGHARVRGVVEVDLDSIALAHTQHRTGHGTVEGPVLVRNAVSQLRGHFLCGQVELDVGGLGAVVNVTRCPTGT